MNASETDLQVGERVLLGLGKSGSNHRTDLRVPNGIANAPEHGTPREVNPLAVFADSAIVDLLVGSRQDRVLFAENHDALHVISDIRARCVRDVERMAIAARILQPSWLTVSTFGKVEIHGDGALAQNAARIPLS